MNALRALVGPLLRGALTRPALTARVVRDRITEDPARLPGLNRLPRTAAGRSRDRARALARSGELSAAVALLPAGDRLRRRYEGELRAYGKDPVPSRGGERVVGTPGRVLHLVTNALPYAQAGYTLRTHRILRAQRAAGLDPVAVTQWGWPARDGHPEAAPSETIDGIVYHRLIPTGPIPAEADRRLQRGADAATELVRTLRPSVLHAATDHRNGTVALAVRERTGLPVLYEIRGFLEESWAAGAALDPNADLEATMPERMRLHRERDTAIMAEADLVATLSETMRAEILGRGIPAGKIVLTPNAVDAALLTQHHDRAAARREWGLADDEFVVGTVSKLAAYEGFDVLLQAAALLRDRGSKVRVLLVGGGPFRPTLDRLAAELGLGPEHLLMPGQVAPDVALRVVAALDVFVCPRLDLRVTRLVTPLKPLEAMAAGRPLVLSDLPALRELVDERSGSTPGRVAAELVRPGDAESLAAGLERLRTDSSRCAELAAAARDVVAERFTWDRLAETYRALYARLGTPNA
ncbi:glycosyltransferase family 4 protein [Sporichthya brevicatena]|uniref:Glycosyltransferase family 4 protein n=1 Tax=Sporichthya brevicatena TaxID=171442 RepID=A0ABP3RWP3_9ACTN